MIEGFYACGEAACVSVHGANRLGGNSLLDLVVFGRASGMFIEQQLREGIDLKDASEADIEAAMAGLNHLNDSTGGENASVLRAELQTIMQNYFGVFRRGDFMQEGIAKLAALRPRIKNVALGDKSNADHEPKQQRGGKRCLERCHGWRCGDAAAWCEQTGCHWSWDCGTMSE